MTVDEWYVEISKLGYHQTMDRCGHCIRFNSSRGGYLMLLDPSKQTEESRAITVRNLKVKLGIRIR